jgi:ABC-type transport system involved in cytochrome c biogenesis permease component
MSFLAEIWRFLRARRKSWLVPILIVPVIFGVLIVVGEGSALAPFIYTLF